MEAAKVIYNYLHIGRTSERTLEVFRAATRKMEAAKVTYDSAPVGDRK